MGPSRALPLCVLLLLAGCAANRGSGVHEVDVHAYLFGAFGGRALDVRDVCGAHAALGVSVRRSALDYIVSVLTLGVYLPHQVRVECDEATP